KLSIGRELQPVGATYIRLQRLRDPPGRNVDDGDSPIPSIRDPYFLSVGRNIESFRAAADLDHCLIPISAGRVQRTALSRNSCIGLLDDAHRARTHVRSHNQPDVRRNANNVRPILARAKNPVHALARWIISADCLGALGCEPRWPSYDGQSMRPAQGSEIDGR